MVALLTRALGRCASILGKGNLRAGGWCANLSAIIRAVRNWQSRRTAKRLLAAMDLPSICVPLPRKPDRGEHQLHLGKSVAGLWVSACLTSHRA